MHLGSHILGLSNIGLKMMIDERRFILHTEDHSRPPLLEDDGILVLPKNRGFSPRHPLPNLHSEKGNKKHQHYLEELDVKPSRPREIPTPPALCIVNSHYYGTLCTQRLGRTLYPHKARWFRNLCEMYVGFQGHHLTSMVGRYSGNWISKNEPTPGPI